MRQTGHSFLTKGLFVWPRLHIYPEVEMLPSQFCFCSSQVGDMANKEEHDQVKWACLCKTSVSKMCSVASKG